MESLGIHPQSLLLSSESAEEARDWEARLGRSLGDIPCSQSSEGKSGAKLIFQGADLSAMPPMGWVFPEGTWVSLTDCVLPQELRIPLVHQLQVLRCSGLHRITELGWWIRDAWAHPTNLHIEEAPELFSLPASPPILGEVILVKCPKLVKPPAMMPLGRLVVKECGCTELPKEFHVYSLELQNLPNLRALPETLVTRELGQSMLLDHLPLVEAMPRHVEATGTLTIRDCPALSTWEGSGRIIARVQLEDLPLLTGIPQDVQIWASLEIRNCPSLRLPEHLPLEGWLVVEGDIGCSVLPQGVTAKRVCLLDCPTLRLSPGTTIPGRLELRGYPIETLPPDLEVEEIVLDSGCDLQAIHPRLAARLEGRTRSIQ